MGCHAVYFQINDFDAAVTSEMRSKNKVPFMSDSPSRDEVKKMIEDAVENKVGQGINDGLDAWMSKFDLKPHHWVYLEAEYNKTLARQGIIRRVIITALVTFVCAATVWSAEEWIKQAVVSHYSAPQKP